MKLCALFLVIGVAEDFSFIEKLLIDRNIQGIPAYLYPLSVKYEEHLKEYQL